MYYNETPRSPSEHPIDHTQDEREVDSEHEKDLHEISLFLGSTHPNPNNFPRLFNLHHFPRRPGSGRACGLPIPPKTEVTK